jgi:hypothetical protein
MNVSEQMRGGRELVPGQSYDLTFPVGRPGRVTVFAAARRRTQLLVQLFPPGAAQPAKVRESTGEGLLTVLEYEVRAGAGLWTARITNCNSHPAEVMLDVSYPGVHDLQARALPAHYVEAIASRLIADTTVRLQHGRNACAVRFPAALGLREFRFTLPAMERTVYPALLPPVEVVERVTDIESRMPRLRLLPGSVANQGGYLRFELGFEEDGVELAGSFPIHLANMKLMVELDLGVAANRLSYSNVRVSFDFDVDLQALPVWLYNPLFDFRDRLQEAVRSGVREAFADVETVEAVAAGMERALETVVGPGARVATVAMENGFVALGLYRPARAAVA